MQVAINAPIITSATVCLFKIILVKPTNAAIPNHKNPRKGLMAKNNAATKTLKAVCIELLIK